MHASTAKPLSIAGFAKSFCELRNRISELWLSNAGLHYALPIHLIPVRILLTLLLINIAPLLAEPCIYESEKGGNISIELDTMYDILPEKGFFPIIIRVDNSTGSEQTISISGNSTGDSRNAIRLSRRVTIPANGTKMVTETVPLEENWSTAGVSLVLSFDHVGTGVRKKFNKSGVWTVAREKDSCAIVFPVSRKSDFVLYSLGTTVQFSGSPLLAERQGFLLQDIPAVWYQLTGVSEIWLTDEEMKSVPSEKEATLKNWVRSGGMLYIVTPERREESVSELGLGRIIGTSKSPDVQVQDTDKSGIRYGQPDVRSPVAVSPLERMQSVKGPIRILLFLYSLVLIILVAVNWYFNIRPALMLFFVIPAIGLVTFTGGLVLILSHSFFGRYGTYETLLIMSDNGKALTRTAASVDSGIVLEEFLKSRAPAVLYHGDTVLQGERNRAALEPAVNRITHLESRNILIEEFFETELTGELSSDGLTLTSTYPVELRELRWIDLNGNCHQFKRLKGSSLMAHGTGCNNDVIAPAFFYDIRLRRGQFLAAMENSYEPQYDGIVWNSGKTYVVGSIMEEVHE